MHHTGNDPTRWDVGATSLWRSVTIARVAMCVLLGALLSACASTLIVPTTVPPSLIGQVRVAGQDKPARYLGDELSVVIVEEFKEAHAQSRMQRPHLFRDGIRTELNVLAISGGGGDGAFVAGLLNGWTKAGNRPEFDIVTGISTGALAAPFAFLGSTYDQQLRHAYTKYATKDLLEDTSVHGVLGGTALADNSKLKAIIARIVTPSLVQSVAREHARGRRLLIGTTNLNTERPVVWDLGRIASQNNEKSILLFRKILLASAAIPGIFPPVSIDVSTGKETLKEIHVDGGITGQVFFLPPQVVLSDILSPDGKRLFEQGNLYVVMNTRLTPEWKQVEVSALTIAERALRTLIKKQAQSDLYKLYVEAVENNFVFKTASIPSSFKGVSKEPFDKAYMNHLYQFAVQEAQVGYKWALLPLGLNNPLKRCIANKESAAKDCLEWRRNKPAKPSGLQFFASTKTFEIPEPEN